MAHYDVHGLSMLALTLRYLRAQGITDVDCALGFEWTGDIGKLWKRAVPRTIGSDREYGLVVMLDCSVHSRHPERTLKAIGKLDEFPYCRLMIIDHHTDTFDLLPEMRHPQLDIVLADVPYLTLAAASRASIPAAALCSLNWADIYRHYFNNRTEAGKILAEMESAYRRW